MEAFYYLLLIIIVIYIISFVQNKKPIINNQLDIFLIESEWLKPFNVIEWNRFIKTINKFKNERYNYNKKYTLYKNVINIFHSLIHKLNNSSQMEKFNRQLEQLDNLLIKYMKSENNVYKFNIRMSPISNESDLALTDSLQEDPYDPKINRSYDWKC